jgi:glycosyltransferase involved in cell wall biosynthesis
MKVLIIATGIAPRLGGVGHYERQLLPHLATSLTARGCQVTVLLSRDGHLSHIDAGVRVVRLPVSRSPGIIRILAEHAYIPALGFRTDVTIALDHRFPLLPVKCGRTLVVVHDVFPLQQRAGDFPIETNIVRRWHYCLTIERAIKAADILVAVSAFTASQIARFFAATAERISVIPPGIDHERFHPPAGAEEIERLRSFYRLPAQFYLFVGGLSFNKNLRLIVDTYSAGGLAGQYMLPVVVVGPSRNPSNPTVQLIERNGIGEYFKFLGYVPDADLPVLYGAARALIHPSWHEGFGFPPIEAMACGTPVIASNRTAIPEVVGDAALLIDPGSQESLAEALREVNDESIRKGLVARGLERVKLFSWERTAQQIAELVCSPRTGPGKCDSGDLS